jgi:hypothetical protein
MGLRHGCGLEEAGDLGTEVVPVEVLFREESLNALKISGNQALVVRPTSDDSSRSPHKRINNRRPPQKTGRL